MNQKKALVLGRSFFVDLWSLLGYESFICESPDSLIALLPEITKRDDLACVMVEENWFENLPVVLRNKLEKMESPLWIPFPSLSIEESQ